MASEVPDDARTEAGTPWSRSRNVAHRRCGPEVFIRAGEVNESPPRLAWARAVSQMGCGVTVKLPCEIGSSGQVTPVASVRPKVF